jgi:hypothetical protein
MKTLAMTLTFLAGLPLAVSAQVSKEDIKKLAGAGISDDVILSYVKANGPMARLSAEDVIELKQAGASEKVLSVILGNGASNVEKQVATRPAAVDSTPYYYTPTTYTTPEVYSSPALYSYGLYASTYSSYPRYYYPRYYSYSSCYPRYSYYSPSFSIGFSSGRYCGPRGYLGVSSYRR